MSDTYTADVQHSTVFGLDYTPAELDDLTARKVEEVPFSGDALARIIRARRGTAHATGQADPHGFANVMARVNLWDSVTPARGNRRVAAVGPLTLDADAEALCNMRGEDPNEDDAWNAARTDLMSGAVAFGH